MKPLKPYFLDLQKTNEKARCWEGKWTQDITLVGLIQAEKLSNVF